MAENFSDLTDNLLSPVGGTVTQDSQVSENLSPENTGTLDERNSKCPDGKILVHNQEGVYFMDKDRWPTLEIAAGPQDQILTQEEDLMDNTAIQLEEQTDKTVRSGKFRNQRRRVGDRKRRNNQQWLPELVQGCLGMVCLLLPKILPEHRRGMILCKVCLTPILQF
jgi:hypothetical protein